MWEETFIFTLIFTGIFFIIPKIIRKRYLYIIVILGFCLYFSAILCMNRLRFREKFSTSSGGYVTTEGGAGNPVFQCGTTGKACEDNTPYCSITERELPANTVDQNIIFNTYAQYVKIFPPATSGDGVVSISQIAIYDETGTNIALNKTPTGNCDTATKESSGQLARSVNGTMRPQAWPNVFSTAVTDRNAASWSIDLGGKRMITSIRYIGRGDYGIKPDEHQRNMGLRFRLYLNATDTPTTGACTTTPEIIYPTSITELTKPIIAPLILKGYNGNTALNVYNKIKRDPPQDFSQYLTDAQAANSYANIYLKNLLTKKFGWTVKAKWDIDSNIITVLSGVIPNTGMTIANASNDGVGAVNSSGSLVQSFPTGTAVTAVNGNVITLDKVSVGSGTNTSIKFNGVITDQQYNAETFKFKNIKSMTTWPSTVDKLQALIDFKSYNTKSGITMQKNPDGTAQHTLDASGNKVFTPVNFTDDGTISALNIIMDTTKAGIQDSSAGNSALTDSSVGSGSGYAIKSPPDTFDWSKVSNDAVPAAAYAVRPAYFDTNNEVTLIGVNTFNTSDENKVSLVAAQSAQISAGSGNESYAQDFSNIAKRTQLEEVFMLGESDSFSSVNNAKAACEAIGATIAEPSKLSDIVTKLSSILNTPAAGTSYTPSAASGTSSQYQKRPQWHEYGFFSDGTKGFPTQKVEIDFLPGGQSGSYKSLSPNSKTNTGAVLTGTTGTKGGAVCYGIKPSIVPNLRTFDSAKLAIINQTGRYLRIWAQDNVFFAIGFDMDIVITSSATSGTEPVDTTISINDGDGFVYTRTINKGSTRQYWEYDMGAQMKVSTVQITLSVLTSTSDSWNNYAAEVAKVPRPQPFFQGYDEADAKNFLWNDKSAFSPPCPSGLSDMICENPKTGLQDLMCLPALPSENTSYSAGGIKPTYQDHRVGWTAGRFSGVSTLYGTCGRFILNQPTTDLPFRHTKCPMDCDPGASFDSKTYMCKYDMNNCEAWISMGIMDLKYTDYVDTSTNIFNGSKYAADFNEKTKQAVGAYNTYKAANIGSEIAKGIFMVILYPLAVIGGAIVSGLTQGAEAMGAVGNALGEFISAMAGIACSMEPLHESIQALISTSGNLKRDMAIIQMSIRKGNRDRLKQRAECLDRARTAGDGMSNAFDAVGGAITGVSNFVGALFDGTAIMGIASGIGDKIAGCFPSDSLVTVEHGSIRIADLKVGDKVLTSNGFSPVYFFGHRDSSGIINYLNIVTKSTRLRISEEHYLEVFRKGVLTVRAGKVQVGDEVWVKGRLEAVIEIYTSKESGIYNPYTLDGTIIVDNVLASCYSESDVVPVEPILRKFLSEDVIDTMAPTIYHEVFAPLRALYVANGPEWAQKYALKMGEQTAYKDLSLTKLLSTAIMT